MTDVKCWDIKTPPLQTLKWLLKHSYHTQFAAKRWISVATCTCSGVSRYQNYGDRWILESMPLKRHTRRQGFQIQYRCQHRPSMVQEREHHRHNQPLICLHRICKQHIFKQHILKSHIVKTASIQISHRQASPLFCTLSVPAPSLNKGGERR